MSFDGRHFAHFSNGDTYFVHADRIGTTNIVTDWNTGTVIQDELHYPWGQVWTTAGSSIEERFASLQHRDTESNLDPTKYRMFSSDAGRWTTPDPADQFSANPVDPQSWNRYGYANENPAGNTDPYGLMACNPNYYHSCSTWGGSDCQMDGIGVSCGFVQDMLDAGVALTCDYYCGAQTVYEGNLTSIRRCDATSQGWICSQTTPTYLGMPLAQFQGDYYNQLNATAAALLTAGESAAEVNAFKAANSSPDWALVANQRGNFDFPEAQSGIYTYDFSSLQNDKAACPYERCDE